MLHLCSWFSLKSWGNNELLICWALSDLRRFFLKCEIQQKLPGCSLPRQTCLDSHWHYRTFKLRLANTQDWISEPPLEDVNAESIVTGEFQKAAGAEGQRKDLLGEFVTTWKFARQPVS